METTKPLATRLIWIAVAVAILVIAVLIPTPEGLTEGGKMSIALIVAGIVLWVTEPIDMAISAICLMVLMPFFHVYDSTQLIWTNFISSVIFFVLASFGFAAALMKTKIPIKLVSVLVTLAKGNAKGIVFMFMVATALVSAFVSDIPCTVLFAGIAASSVLEYHKVAPSESKFGRALMIGIVFASLIGGWMTPAGSSMNVMAMGMMASSTGTAMTFAQWCMVAIPISLILFFVAYGWLMIVSKPEPVSEETKLAIEQKAKEVGKLDIVDKKTLGIMVILIICWIASNWTGWDATVIAVLGLVAFFLPGIDILTFKEFAKAVNWGIVLLIGAVQSIAGGIQASGAGSWLLNSTVAGFAAAGAFATVAAISVFVPIIRCFLPIGPAINAICIIPLIGITGAMGISPAVITVIVGMNASNAFVLGIDNNPIVTFKYGYWSMKQYLICGIVPMVVMMILHMTLVVPLVAMAGL